MKKLTFALATIIVVASLFMLTTQVYANSAEGINSKKPVFAAHVGWVTDYQPGVSITIQAHDGNYYTFGLTGNEKILPGSRASDLKVGSRVTILARRDTTSNFGWVAFGIVVHPAGSGAGSAPPTATPTSTSMPTETSTSVPTDTPTMIPSDTPTPTPTETATPTSTP